jgi:hypothetical protein
MHVVVCPFCGAQETDRLTIEGHRFVVFGCMFTPEVDPTMDDDTLGQKLVEAYAKLGTSYFRGQCDRLHLIVTRGEAHTPSGPAV